MPEEYDKFDVQNIIVDDEFYQSEYEAGLEIEVPEVESMHEGGIGGGEYVPRLTAPAKDNPYYITTAYGGVNECILGKPQYSPGSALANCVGYAWGRAYELLQSRPKLSRGNAENWWGYGDGYKRGQEPKLDAIACWRKGKAGDPSDGAGHVAVVEEIEGNTFRISQSGYNSATPFWLTTYTVGKCDHGSYYFQGFIYIDDWIDPKKDVLVVDGFWGPTTTRYTQRMLGTTVDGIVSGQPKSNKQYLPCCEESSWKFVLIATGSQMVKALQKLVGATPDGKCGPKTVMAIQKFLNDRGFGCGTPDGSMGPKTVKAWQRFINAYFKAL
jgi:peptidoglycan hydrolase-like protein with peptidoglycan-binding domain